MRSSSGSDLHGAAPDTSPVAVLLVDVINDLEFDGGEELLEQALPMADRIAELKRRARALAIPVLYVNDNFGRWRSDFRQTVDHCLHDSVRGRPVVERLVPEPDDYFVLKPKHSAFFGTTLGLLLGHLGARHLVLTGMAADACVLFSAAEAHVRDFRVLVPSDCVAAQRPEHREQALELMRRVLEADTCPSSELDFERVIAGSEI